MSGQPPLGKEKATQRPKRLHPMVAETKRQYRGLKPYDGWRKPTDSGLIEPPAAGAVRLHVAPVSLDRALRLADALLKAAEARGHMVALDKAGEYACIVVAGQFVGFQLREGTKRFPHIPTAAEERQRKRNPYALIPEWEHRPTGVLTFEIDQNRYDGTRRRWSEGERWKQEDRIEAVLDGIETVAALPRDPGVCGRDAAGNRRCGRGNARAARLGLALRRRDRPGLRAS